MRQMGKRKIGKGRGAGWEIGNEADGQKEDRQGGGATREIGKQGRDGQGGGLFVDGLFGALAFVYLLLRVRCVMMRVWSVIHLFL